MFSVNDYGSVTLGDIQLYMINQISANKLFSKPLPKITVQQKSFALFFFFLVVANMGSAAHYASSVSVK